MNQQEPVSGLELLYREIMKRGSINKNGDHFIKYVNENNDNVFGIYYDEDEEQFGFNAIVDNGKMLVTMQLDRNGNKKTKIHCFYVNTCLFETEVEAGLADIVFENNLNFNILKSSFCSDDFCQTASNLLTDLCMVGWSTCLVKETGMLMSELGFINYRIIVNK